MSTEFGGEVLRQHGEFVRELARALTRDPGQAEDIAQDTWLRWFRRPPSAEARPRGWLTLVARGITRNRRRGEERRTGVEARVAPGERLDSTPFDACVQAEQLERVIVAVRALEAPYRDVILARYFRGLPVRELALESGTSEETLRTRERRALEQLRAKLDREFGGRAAWAVGLAEFARRSPFVPAPEGASAASAAHGTLWLTAGVLAVAGTLGVVLWKAQGAGTDDTVAAGSVSEASAPAVTTAEASAEPVSAREVLAASVAPVASSGNDSGKSGGQGDSSSAVTSGEIVVHGTFRFEDGSPAAGATWAFQGWESNEEAVIRYGLPEEWTDPSGTTDAQGELHASFFPPQAFQFVLEVAAPGHAAATWRWHQLAPGTTLEVGEVTLMRGVTLTGRMVDPSGNPLLGEEWRVYAESVGLRANTGWGRDETSVSVSVDPTTGAFVLENAHPGQLKLKAYSRMANWIEAPRLTAQPGETRVVDIVYSGPRNANRITVSTSCYPLYVISDPEADAIQLVGPDGTRRTLRKIEGSSQSYAFDDLPPGEYVVEIADPRFLPYTSKPVTPGSMVSAKLQPCSLLVLDVRDADGVVLVPDQITVEFLNVNFRPNNIVVHDGSKPFDGNVRLFPGDYLVHVQAGEQRGIASVAEVGFNETRPVTVTLGNQARLAGRLTRADGSAQAGAEVLLLAPAREGDSDASPILGPNTFTSNDAEHRKQLAATTSDDQGAFEFLIPMAGSYVVHASAGSGLAANSPVLALGTGESRTDLELVLPLGATVTGRLLVSSGSLAGLRVWIGPVAPNVPPVDMNTTARPVAADGSFHLEGLPGGTVEARLLLPISDDWQFAWEELGTLELVAGQTLTHDFTLAAAPGQLTLAATMDGTPQPGVRVTLTRQAGSHQQRVQTTLGPGGVRNAQPLFAGTWSVLLADPGREWNVRAPDVLVPSGGGASASVAITVAQGTLRFLDAQGQPLAGKNVRCELDTPDESRTFQTKTTDAEGRASFLLSPGDYLFSLFTLGATELPPGTRITWTSTGPTVSDVQL